MTCNYIFTCNFRSCAAISINWSYLEPFFSLHSFHMKQTTLPWPFWVWPHTEKLYVDNFHFVLLVLPLSRYPFCLWTFVAVNLRYWSMYLILVIKFLLLIFVFVPFVFKMPFFSFIYYTENETSNNIQFRNNENPTNSYFIPSSKK